MTEDTSKKNLKRSEETLRLDPEDAERLFQATVKLRKTKQAIMSEALLEKLTAIESPGTPFPPGLQGKSPISKGAQGLLQPPPGTKLKSTQLALYRDLAEKVAEVIAEGSTDLVAILAKGIRWAYADLRPSRPKSEDHSAHAHATAKKDGTR